MGLRIVLCWLLLIRRPEGYCKTLCFLSLSLHTKCDVIQFYALFHWHRAVGVNCSSNWKRWWGGGECCDGSALKQGWQGRDQGRRPYLHMESSLHLLASRYSLALILCSCCVLPRSANAACFSGFLFFQLSYVELIHVIPLWFCRVN